MKPCGLYALVLQRCGTEPVGQRGDIYLTALDPAPGHEIKKTRPALVIQNDVSNRYGMTTIVAAIASKVNTPPYPNEVILHPNGSGLGVTSTVRLDQIRTVDRRRLASVWAKSIPELCAELMRPSRSVWGLSGSEGLHET